MAIVKVSFERESVSPITSAELNGKSLKDYLSAFVAEHYHTPHFHKGDIVKVKEDGWQLGKSRMFKNGKLVTLDDGVTPKLIESVGILCINERTHEDEFIQLGALLDHITVDANENDVINDVNKLATPNDVIDAYLEPKVGDELVYGVVRYVRWNKPQFLGVFLTPASKANSANDGYWKK